VPDRAGETLRLGLVGCGGIASFYHLPILRRTPGARVVAVADPAPAARARACRIAPDLEVEEDAAAVFARSDVDAVIVCADNTSHASLGLAAAAAGKHLYLEKPIALSTGDARRVLGAFEGADVTGAIGFNYRFHPLHERAHCLIREGAIGGVREVRAVFWEPVVPRRMPAWKRTRATGGGVLLDLASHTVDLVRWHLSAELAEVRAQIRSRRTEHDHAELRLRTADGVPVRIWCGFGGARADVFEVLGERGLLRVDRYRDRLWVLPPRRRLGDRPPVARVAARARRLLRPSPEPSFARALGAFVEHLAGQPRALPSFHDAVRSLEVVFAAERSAA
jgi:myo-inositol 2-dehydrogenase/D-chiro-inositol 1-dehydrogenase